MVSDFFEKYKYKIKNTKEVVNLVGKIPRKDKVILKDKTLAQYMGLNILHDLPER